MKILNSNKKKDIDSILQDFLNDKELDKWLAEGPILPPIRINLLDDIEDDDGKDDD